MATWSIKNKEIEVRIGYAFARGPLKKDFGINLLALFEGANLDSFTRLMVLDDEKMEDLAWHFAKETFHDRDEFFDSFKGTTELEDFKSAFWKAVEDFFEPTKKAMLLQIKKEVPKLFLDMISSKMDELQNNISET